eukprot:5309592-Pyramimonas_sp.AAC.1
MPSHKRQLSADKRVASDEHPLSKKFQCDQERDRAFRSGASAAGSRRGSRSPDGGGKSLEKRKTAASGTVAAANEVLAIASSKWSFRQHWEGRLRKRESDAFLTRLNTHGRKCGNVLANAEAADVSTQLFNARELLEKRSSLFESLRGNFVKFAMEDMSQDHVDALKGAPIDLLGTIITSELNQALNSMCAAPGARCDVVTAFGSVADAKPRSQRFSVGLLAKDQSIASECQKGLVLSLAERLWKHSDANWIVRCCQLLSELVGDCVVDAREIAEDGDALDDESWFAQPKIDMCCILLMGKCLEASLSESTLPRDTVSKICAMVECKNRLSPRLRAHFRQICGAQ